MKSDAQKPISFSIIIPTYNAAKTIERAVNSVLDQSYPAHEIIIVDDASSDDTVALIEKKYGTSIKLIKKIKNQGGSATRNAGMDAATGDYIAFLDADDAWHPHKLAITNTILTSDMHIQFFFHPFTQKDIMIVPVPETITIYKIPFIKLLRENRVATSCAMVKNDPSFRFDTSMRYTEDYDLWLRIAYKYKVYFIDVPLTQIFRPFTSEGGVSENKWAMRRGEMRAYTHLIKLNPLFALLWPFLITTSLAKHIYKTVARKPRKPSWSHDK